MAVTVARVCSSSPVLADDHVCFSVASSWKDTLWSEIDMDESYLVSSQFAKAANLSRTILQKLKSIQLHSQHDSSGLDPEEIDNMIESAGMVLIQAQHAIGSTSTIFQELEAIFEHIAVVPSSILLAGICLQISTGLYPDARTAIESYLEGWAYTSEDEKSCMLCLDQTQNTGRAVLAPDTYIKVLELYCVQVLAEGLSCLDIALQCATEVDIPMSQKQMILDKLQNNVASRERCGEGLVRQCKTSRGNVASAYPDLTLSGHVLEDAEMDEEKVKHHVPKEIDLQLSLRSFRLFAPIMGLLSSCMKSSGYAVRIWWMDVFSQQKTALCGAATFFIMFALYKQRVGLWWMLQSCRKVLRDNWHVMCMGLVDFWQLAFNVHLNPLAAVQPLPSSQNVRM